MKLTQQVFDLIDGLRSSSTKTGLTVPYPTIKEVCNNISETLHIKINEDLEKIARYQLKGIKHLHQKKVVGILGTQKMF